MLSCINKIMLLALMVALAACSSTLSERNIDFDTTYDFSSVRKVAFYALIDDVTGDSFTQLTAFQKDRINIALQRILESKGYEVVDDKKEADLLINWRLSQVEKQDIRSTLSPGYGVFVGYGCYGCYGENVYVTDYTKATFMIDMINPESSRSVWRGVTWSKLKGEALTGQSEIDMLMYSIIDSFPPDVAKTKNGWRAKESS